MDNPDKLQSFGSNKHYGDLIRLIQHDKVLWKKVANLLNNIRRDLRPWAFVDRTNQIREARKYILRALKDTKLPDEVKCLVQRGIYTEFGINTFDNE